MAQINLLGNESSAGRGLVTKAPLYLVRILALAFMLVLAYWGYLYVQERLVTSKISKVQQEILATQKKLLEDPKRQELVRRQGQLVALNGLLTTHEQWSKILPELARVTLSSARYLSFSIGNNGTAKMTVNVSSYTEMDKFLQAFELPEFSNVFSEVKVTSTGKVQQGDLQMVRFDIEVKYD